MCAFTVWNSQWKIFKNYKFVCLSVLLVQHNLKLCIFSRDFLSWQKWKTDEIHTNTRKMKMNASREFISRILVKYALPNLFPWCVACFCTLHLPIISVFVSHWKKFPEIIHENYSNHNYNKFCDSFHGN